MTDETVTISARYPHKAVRNVVFNDLKITKAEIDALIVKTVNERITAIMDNRQFFGAAIDRAIDRAMRNRFRNLDAMVAEEVRKAVKDHVDKKLDGRLTIDIATK